MTYGRLLLIFLFLDAMFVHQPMVCHNDKCYSMEIVNCILDFAIAGSLMMIGGHSGF